MAYGDYSRTTELEAVNTCLSIIGEQPVNSLDLSGVTKASLARDLIYNVSRRIQNEGLNCNTEIKALTPNVSDEIQLPGNAISVEPVSAADNHFIERDSKLYDRKNNTYTITDPVTVRITYFLEWTDLPEHVRNYISIVAARIFQTRYVSDEALHMFSEMDEAKAQAKFARLELDSAPTTGEVFDHTRTSELDIINACLGLVKETPQTSLTSTGTSKVEFARALLHNTSRRIQAEGLNCNTEIVELPVVSTEIPLPANCLSVEVRRPYDHRYVEREGKLYDRIGNTFTIADPVEVELTKFLEWDDLPEHVRSYIGMVVIRLFQAKYIIPTGDDQQQPAFPFTEMEEAKAQAKFARRELNSADLSGDEPENKSEELEIINMCLDTVKETPQTTLTSVGTAKARHARTLLNSVNRSVQNEKLNCNTARRTTLEPDQADAIVLPTNCLDVTTLYSIDRHLTERNGKLYDQKNHTYEITRDVVADVTVFLPFSELPEHVREYIKIRTIRLFQKKYLDRPEYHTFTDEDEYRARAAFMRKEYFNMPTSILDNVNINPRVYRR